MIRKPAAILFVLSLAILALALIPAAGLAAKGGAAGKPGGGGGGDGKPGGGGGGGGGTIELVLLNSADAVANYGEQVTFRVSTSATSYPYVTLKCSQGGLVYQASKGIFPTSLGQNFTLGPTPSWQGGDADCTATLEDWDSYSRNGSITPLVSMTFHVYA